MRKTWEELQEPVKDRRVWTQLRAYVQMEDEKAEEEGHWYYDASSNNSLGISPWSHFFSRYPLTLAGLQLLNSTTVG